MFGKYYELVTGCKPEIVLLGAAMLVMIMSHLKKLSLRVS
jgi:hypothetical protein